MVTLWAWGLELKQCNLMVQQTEMNWDGHLVLLMALMKAIQLGRPLGLGMAAKLGYDWEL